MARLSLQDWIGDALTDDTKEAPLSMLSLVHLRGMEEAEVHAVRFGPGKAWTTAELSKLFRGRAENYAAEIPGVQQFCLLAFYGDNPEPRARKPIMVNGASEHSGLATEGPTKDGLTQQAMRHTEVMLQMCFAQMSSMFAITQQTLKQQAEAQAQLMAENRDAFAIVKQMTLERAQESAANAIEVATHERNMAFQQKMLQLGPAVINKLTGKSIFPESTEDTAIIEAIVDALDEEKVTKLIEAEILPQNLLGMLAARMHQIMQRRNEQSLKVQAEVGEDEEDEEDEDDNNERENDA